MSTQQERLSFLIPLLFLGMVSGGEAAIFNVTDATEFQNALTAARGNGEDDTINLASGLYSTLGLTYQLAAGEDNNSLLIQGVGATTTILDFGGMNNLDISTTGLADDSSAHVTIRGITIQNGNGCRGGGLEMRSDNANLTLEHDFFLNNAACDGDGGGADVRTNGGTISIINCVFSGNTHDETGNQGGGANVRVTTGLAILTNNTITGNATDEGVGDGIAIGLLEDVAAASIHNNIVRGNGDEDIYVDDDGFRNGTGAPTSLFNNDFGIFIIQDGDNLSQGGNINQDPLLTADFHLLAGSPAIDTGDNGAPMLPSTDIDGEARVMNATVDMGVDEYPGQQVSVIEIPTMTPWGMILLFLLVGLGPVYHLRRRRLSQR